MTAALFQPVLAMVLGPHFTHAKKGTVSTSFLRVFRTAFLTAITKDIPGSENHSTAEQVECHRS